MISMNRSSGMGANPMPGNQMFNSYYNPNFNAQAMPMNNVPYSNPYCNVQSVPAGNPLPYNQRLYNGQPQMVNPNMTYESWKSTAGISSCSAAEEDYYLNLYNTQILPQQRIAMVNQQRSNFYQNIMGQTQYPMQQPIVSPYAYQNYIPGYDKVSQDYAYNMAMCGVMPKLYAARAASQAEIMKKMEADHKNQLFLIKKFTVMAMRHCHRSEEDITNRLKKIDEDNKPRVINGRYKPTFENKPNTNTTAQTKKIRLRLVRGNEVIRDFGERSVKGIDYGPKSFEEIQAIQAERFRMHSGQEIVYQPTMNPKTEQMFRDSIEKYKGMSLTEFLNDHGGILVGEAMESQFIKAYHDRMHNYKLSDYMKDLGNNGQYCQQMGTIGNQPQRIPVPSSAPLTKNGKSYIIGQEVSFVDFLNVMDIGDPVSHVEYSYIKGLTKDEDVARMLILYKAFHKDFDPVEYLKNGANLDEKAQVELNERLINFYRAMLERRPELRSRKDG